MPTSPERVPERAHLRAQPPKGVSVGEILHSLERIAPSSTGQTDKHPRPEGVSSQKNGLTAAAVTTPTPSEEVEIIEPRSGGPSSAVLPEETVETNRRAVEAGRVVTGTGGGRGEGVGRHMRTKGVTALPASFRPDEDLGGECQKVKPSILLIILCS